MVKASSAGQTWLHFRDWPHVLASTHGRNVRSSLWGSSRPCTCHRQTHDGPELTGATPLALPYGTAISLLNSPRQQPLDVSLNVDSPVSLVARTDLLGLPN